MKTLYKVQFDKVIYSNGRIAENAAFTVDAPDTETAQENVIELIEDMGAVHGNILSISTVKDMPQSGLFPITVIGDPDHKAKQAECVARLTRRF